MDHQPTATQVLDREFLTIRTRLIDIAAAMDRIDRSAEAEEARADARTAKLLDAARVLAGDEPDRTERIQLVFSDSYDERWRAEA